MQKKQINKSFSIADYGSEEECFSAVQRYINEVIVPEQENYIDQKIEKTYYYDLIRSFNHYIDNNNIELLTNIIKKEFGLQLGESNEQG